MLISTRGRYALRVMIDMAEHLSEGCVKLKDVAERQNISEKYLEAIVHSLVSCGILAGTRGKQGGYRLTRPPEEITVWEILCQTEGSLSSVSCQKEDAAPCERMDFCRSRPLWQGLDRVICEYLSGYSLADLARLEREGADME